MAGIVFNALVYRHYVHLIVPTILGGGYYYVYLQVRKTKLILQILIEQLLCAGPCSRPLS